MGSRLLGPAYLSLRGDISTVSRVSYESLPSLKERSPQEEERKKSDR